MNKGQIAFIVIWSLLALASFVAGMWIPVLVWRIISFIFGIANCGIILSFGVLIGDLLTRKDHV